MWSNYLLIILLCICVITDIRHRKIYNVILFPCFLIALILHSFTDGMNGLSFTVLGTITGLGILFIPFCLGGMGAGDVKLLAVIGAIKGMSFVLMAALYMALAGGIMALLVILINKGMKKRLYHLIYFFHGLRHGVRFPLFPDKEVLQSTYPYGIAIAAGAIYQVFQTGGLLL